NRDPFVNQRRVERTIPAPIQEDGGIVAIAPYVAIAIMVPISHHCIDGQTSSCWDRYERRCSERAVTSTEKQANDRAVDRRGHEVRVPIAVKIPRRNGTPGVADRNGRTSRECKGPRWWDCLGLGWVVLTAIACQRCEQYDEKPSCRRCARTPVLHLPGVHLFTSHCCDMA